MNNIYVDELPKSCDGCCFNNDSYCVNNEYVIENYFTQTKHPNCPLKPLSDRLAEERKKVIHDIDCELYTKMVVYGDTPSYTDIHKILEQIERGEK